MEKIEIRLQENHDIPGVLNQLQSIQDSEVVNITLDFRYYDYARHYHLIPVGCFLRELYDQNKINDLDIIYPIKDDVKRYISRMDFYDMIGWDYKEDFTRQDSSGRLVEITQIDGETANNVNTKVSQVVKENFKVPKVVLTGLHYAVTEVISNVEAHSGSSSEGWVAAQDYRNRVEICIVDNGKGIPESLRQNAAYSHYSDEDAVYKAIDYRVTRCPTFTDGQGLGLYMTSRIIEKCGGVFELYSRGYGVKIQNGLRSELVTPGWQGTIVFMRFPKNQALDGDTLLGVFRDHPSILIEDGLAYNELW